MTLVPVESLRLHPDSERVPLAGPADLAALRSSLRENGQQDPIDVTPDGLILDGRTRWRLLQELGSLTIQVREVVIPDRDQTHYIVDRALARRHLTADQKRVLNGLLRTAVVEVVENAKTGEEMRIGMSRPERAAKLGVSAVTVKDWDTADVDRNIQIPSPNAPTHIRRGGGNPTPYPVSPAKPIRSPRVTATPRHTGPQWHRQFTRWCRAVLPEDRKHLLQMSVELHKALGLLDLTCGQQEESNDEAEDRRRA